MINVCDVLFVPKNENWNHSSHSYLVGTDNIEQTEKTAMARLMIDEPEHYKRFKPLFNFRQIH